MNQNIYRFWVALLVISGGIALWFMAIALLGVVKFALLNSTGTAQVLHWDVHEISSSQFAIEAKYQFRIKENAYIDKTKFESPRFLNRFAAESHIAHRSDKSWKVWYSSSNPRYSSLEKIFPQKQCFQALLTLGVFAYFFFVRKRLSLAFSA